MGKCAAASHRHIDKVLPDTASFQEKFCPQDHGRWDAAVGWLRSKWIVFEF